MSHEPEQLDEDRDNPFDFFESLGFQVEDEEDDEDETDDCEAQEFDEEIYWLNLALFESAIGGWGQFAEGLAWDGSRDLSDEPEAHELSLVDHAFLVIHTRCEERRNSQSQ
jgi:hypothetical protein